MCCRYRQYPPMVPCDVCNGTCRRPTGGHPYAGHNRDPRQQCAKCCGTGQVQLAQVKCGICGAHHLPSSPNHYLCAWSHREAWFDWCLCAQQIYVTCGCQVHLFVLHIIQVSSPLKPASKNDELFLFWASRQPHAASWTNGRWTLTDRNVQNTRKMYLTVFISSKIVWLFSVLFENTKEQNIIQKNSSTLRELPSLARRTDLGLRKIRRKTTSASLIWYTGSIQSDMWAAPQIPHLILLVT